MTATTRLKPAITQASRRSFLKKSVAAAAAAATLSTRPQYAFATPGNPAAGDALIVVFIRGGVDGLNLTPPIGSAYDSYAALRPTINVTPDRALPLDSSNPNVVFPQGHDGVIGMHPMLQPLYDGAWANGQMAVLPASGLPNYESTNRSHFRVQTYWENGSADGSVNTGFLGRLETALNAAGPMASVSTSGATQGILSGGTLSYSIDDVATYGVNGFSDSTQATSALAAMYDGGTGTVNATGAQALEIPALLRQLDVAGATGFANDDFARDLRDMAVMLKSNIGLVGGIVNINGAGLWDTHRVQEARWGRVLPELCAALQAFVDYLGPDGMAETTVAVVTEFGRTVAENGNEGTDHGRGSTMFVLGGGIQGGVYGHDYPDEYDLDALAASGHTNAVPVFTDWRQPLDEILQARMGVSGLFPTMQAPVAPLGIVRT